MQKISKELDKKEYQEAMMNSGFGSTLKESGIKQGRLPKGRIDPKT